MKLSPAFSDPSKDIIIDGTLYHSPPRSMTIRGVLYKRVDKDPAQRVQYTGDMANTITAREYMIMRLGKAPDPASLMVFSKMAQNRYKKRYGVLPQVTDSRNHHGGGVCNVFMVPDDMPILLWAFDDYTGKGKDL